MNIYATTSLEELCDEAYRLNDPLTIRIIELYEERVEELEAQVERLEVRVEDLEAEVEELEDA